MMQGIIEAENIDKDFKEDILAEALLRIDIGCRHLTHLKKNELINKSEAVKLSLEILSRYRIVLEKIKASSKHAHHFTVETGKMLRILPQIENMFGSLQNELLSKEKEQKEVAQQKYKPGHKK